MSDLAYFRERSRHLDERLKELYAELEKRDKKIRHLESVTDKDVITVKLKCEERIAQVTETQRDLEAALGRAVRLLNQNAGLMDDDERAIIRSLEATLESALNRRLKI